MIIPPVFEDTAPNASHSFAVSIYILAAALGSLIGSAYASFCMFFD